MSLPRAVVFDCDGVLFESKRANLAYYNQVLEHFGVAPVLESDHQRCHLCHTSASPEVFAELLGKGRVEEALAFAANLGYQRFIPYLQPEPELREVLESLSARLPLAVATNRGSSLVEILAHFSLERYFQTLVTSRDVARPKPYPDMLFEASRRLGLEPGEVLFVGDSRLDREAAAAAGMPFVAYRSELGEGVKKVSGHRDLLSLAGEVSPAI